MAMLRCVYHDILQIKHNFENISILQRKLLFRIKRITPGITKDFDGFQLLMNATQMIEYACKRPSYNLNETSIYRQETISSLDH
jgi:hypothetical protein